MITIGIALKNRADVEVAYELSAYGGQIRAVDYSPFLRLFVRADQKLALRQILKSRVVPSDRSVTNKASANYLLTRLGGKPIWKAQPEHVLPAYASRIIELPLATVSAFEVGEAVKQTTPHSDIIRQDILWQLRFPLDVVRIAVDAIQVFINHADTPTAVRTAEDLLTDIELRLVRLDG